MKPLRQSYTAGVTDTILVKTASAFSIQIALYSSWKPLWICSLLLSSHHFADIHEGNIFIPILLIRKLRSEEVNT